MNTTHETTNEETYWTTAELARRWKVSEGTIRSQRYRKVGPPYFKPFGERGEARYPIKAVLEYEKTHTIEGGSK